MRRDQRAPGTCRRDTRRRLSRWSGRAGNNQGSRQYKHSAQSDSDTCPAGRWSSWWRRWRSGRRLEGRGSTWFRPGCPETCRPRTAGRRSGLADPERSRLHKEGRRSGRAVFDRCLVGTGGIVCCLWCFGRFLGDSPCRWTARAGPDTTRASRTCRWGSP